MTGLAIVREGISQTRVANPDWAVESTPASIWLRAWGTRRFLGREMDERRALAPDLVLDLGNQGILGMAALDPANGGLSFDQQLRIEEQLGAIDITVAAFVGVNNALGITPIRKFGTHSQRCHLPDLAAGRKLAAFAFTEPGAGSDPRRMEARAARQPDGRWLLSGTKSYIGTAKWAGLIVVLANAFDGDRALGATAFLIATDLEGVVQGEETQTLGLRAMVQNHIHFENAALPSDAVLGVVGGGFDVANEAMQLGRVGIGAIALGALKRCFQIAFRYAERRQIGDSRLLDRHLVQEQLLENAYRITLVEHAVRACGAALDANGIIPPALSMALKMIASECAWSTVDRTLQILGGRGYDEANGVAQMLRDARVLRIFEGPTETLATYIGALALFKTRNLAAELQLFLAKPEMPKSVTSTIAMFKDAITLLPAAGKSRAIERLSFELGDILSWLLLAALLERNVPDPLDPARVWTDGIIREKRMRAITLIKAPVPENIPLLCRQLAEVIEAECGPGPAFRAYERHGTDELLRPMALRVAEHS